MTTRGLLLEAGIYPIADHSWWARSVRWSCGRPSMPGHRIRVCDPGEMWADLVRAERMRAYVGLGINHPGQPLIITAT